MSYRPELEAAAEAARAAGAILKECFGERLEVLQKAPDSGVTQADAGADICLRSMLTKAFPGYGWLSEETADSRDRLDKRRAWIVDPLDGTKEFVAGIPEFCVSVGLVDAGKPVVAAIYNPIADELFLAEAGKGTTLNGRPVRTTAQTEAVSASVLASRSETARGEWTRFGGAMRIREMGSVAYKLAVVSRGGADATFTLTPKNEWDICAGVLLVQEAGGKATGLAGEPLLFNQPSPLKPGMIAAAGTLHASLVDMIVPVVAGKGRSN